MNNALTELKTLTVPLNVLYPAIREVLDSGKTITLPVRGNSMSPFIKDMRDRAVFAPLGDRKIRRGDIVFYQRTSGQFVMHRVYAVDKNGVMTMLGDAQWALEPGIRPEQLRAYVTKIFRNGKVVNCEKSFWRWLMTLYMSFRIRTPRLSRFIIQMTRYAVKLVTDPACVKRYIQRKLDAKNKLLHKTTRRQ